jgi:hypothetical protein
MSPFAGHQVEVVVSVDTDQRLSATFPARTMITRPVERMSEIEHVALATMLIERFRNAACDEDRKLVAGGAWRLAAGHPEFGAEVRLRLLEAVAAWTYVVVSVAITDKGIGVSIGDERIDLIGPLRRHPSGTSRGGGGTWPELR